VTGSELKAGVSVSTETDTPAPTASSPARKQAVHESCPMPRLSSAARSRVRLSHPRVRLRGASKSRLSASGLVLTHQFDLIAPPLRGRRDIWRGAAECRA